MSGNKLKLNWKYALGEVVLIFIGISLAIGFQNFNEERKSRKKETQLLTQLKSEVTLLLDELRSDIDFTQKIYALTDSILTYDPQTNTKSFEDFFDPAKNFNYFLLNSQLFPSTTAYENWRAMGLDLIRDVSLRIYLGDLYDRRITRAMNWENEVFTYETKIRGMIEESFIDHPTAKQIRYPATMPKSLEAFQNDRHLIHVLQNYQRFRIVQIRRYQTVSALASKVLERIDQNLQQ